MTKREKIESLFQQYDDQVLTDQEIATISETTLEWTQKVLRAKKLKLLLQREKETMHSHLAVKKRMQELEEPKHQWELVISKYPEFSPVISPDILKVTVKVNLLPDGRVELIYKSRM